MHLLIVEVCVDSARNAEGIETTPDKLEALEMLGIGQRRLGLEHGLERAVLVQQAVELAVVVMADLGAFGLGRILGVAACFERERIRSDGVH